MNIDSFSFLSMPGENVNGNSMRNVSHEGLKRKGLGMDFSFSDSLSADMDYDQVFRVVKSSVKLVTGKERAGLGLAMSNLPWNLGAFWEIGGNYIVMNESLVNAMKKLSKTTEEFNAFVYMILTHEYTHSLGYIDEEEARHITGVIANSVFGKDHIVARICNGDLWAMYPELRYVRGGRGENIRIISKFDSSSVSYIA